MTRFLALAAFVFFIPLCQWLGDDPAHRVTLTEPRVVRVVGEVVFIYDRAHLVFHEVKRGRLLKYTTLECTVYTFYSDGHCTVSKGE